MSPHGTISGVDETRANVLTSESCRSRDRSELYRRIIERLGHDPSHVCEIRVTESEIEVDLIDFDDPDWPATTARYVDLNGAPLLGALGQRATLRADRVEGAP